MKRIILDTNIYGKIVIDGDRDRLVENIVKNKSLVVYGFILIRKELRDTPRKIKFEKRNLRARILEIYDAITRERTLEFNEKCSQLADQYFIAYKNLDGVFSKDEVIKDFRIVACAALNMLDILISDDNRTMLSENAIRAFRVINAIRKLKMPEFANYEKFKKDIK